MNRRSMETINRDGENQKGTNEDNIFSSHTWEKIFKHSSSCNELVFNHPAKIEFTFNQNKFAKFS